jgi:hypothetical protein
MSCISIKVAVPTLAPEQVRRLQEQVTPAPPEALDAGGRGIGAGNGACRGQDCSGARLTRAEMRFVAETSALSKQRSGWALPAASTA